MKQFLHSGKYSQQGEQGIIDEALKRMKITNGYCAEFGAPTKTYCSNIFHLLEKGYFCEWFDSDPQEDDIEKFFITPENVNAILMDEYEVLSIDIDGNDYAVWKAYTGKAKIVVIEINSSLDPDEDHFTPDDGANFSMMNKLAKSKGYELLIHTGNLIYVQKEYIHLFPDRSTEFNRSWLK